MCIIKIEAASVVWGGGGGGGGGVLAGLSLVLDGRVALLLQYTRAHERLRDHVGVAVGGRPAVLEVALLLLAHGARDADAGAAVRHAGGELVDARRLVVARQAAGVVQAPLGVVGADVVHVPLGQPLDGLLDRPGGRW